MTRPPSLRTADGLRVGVIGAGVIGLCAALELRRRGAVVVVYDRGPEIGAGATARAGGMLGLTFEAAETDAPGVFELARRSAELWPRFAAELERPTGSIDFASEGALCLASTESDVSWLNRLAAASIARGLPTRWLSPREVQREEPAITGTIKAGLALDADHQLDPALLLTRLAEAARAADVDLRLGQAVDQVRAGADFELADGARFDRLLLATGAAASSPTFIGPGGERLDLGLGPIVPVKGQMVALAAGAGSPRRVLRTRDVYIVPKTRWTLLGASQERGRGDVEVAPAVSDALHAAAAGWVGALKNVPRLSAWAGVRPTTPDDAPMIGESALKGVFAALGHYRNGILLAPATAEMLAAHILDGNVSALAAAFEPRRFDNRLAAPHSPYELPV